MGRVKTRLASDIGTAQATRFCRHSAVCLIQRLRAAPFWRLVLAITPDRAIYAAFSQARPLHRVPQGNGDLGQRMQRLFDNAPPGPAIIIGSDIPGITPTHIREAFRLLGKNDAVLGPAPDGGFWLVGLRRTPRVPRIFTKVAWSGPNTLADTLANLAGHRVDFAAKLEDVDDGPSYRRLGGTDSRVVLLPHVAPMIVS